MEIVNINTFNFVIRQEDLFKLSFEIEEVNSSMAGLMRDFEKCQPENIGKRYIDDVRPFASIESKLHHVEKVAYSHDNEYVPFVEVTVVFNYSGILNGWLEGGNFFNLQKELPNNFNFEEAKKIAKGKKRRYVVDYEGNVYKSIKDFFYGYLADGSEVNYSCGVVGLEKQYKAFNKVMDVIEQAKETTKNATENEPFYKRDEVISACAFLIDKNGFASSKMYNSTKSQLEGHMLCQDEGSLDISEKFEKAMEELKNKKEKNEYELACYNILSQEYVRDETFGYIASFVGSIMK